MEQIDLRSRARRAYELGRARASAKAAGAALLLAAVAIVLGRPLDLTAVLSAALVPLVFVLAFRGRAAGRAVWPGLAAGGAAMLLPLAVRTAGCELFGPSCMRFCLPAAILGGAIAGAGIGLLAARQGENDREFLLSGMAIAGLAASLGCTLAGASGVLGMAAAAVAAGTPIWLGARVRR